MTKFTGPHAAPGPQFAPRPHMGSHLEELDRETEEPEGLCCRRPRGGDPTPGRLLGDLDRRHGSFHSSGRLMTRTASFFRLGSTGLLRGAEGGATRRPPSHTPPPAAAQEGRGGGVRNSTGVTAEPADVTRRAKNSSGAIFSSLFNVCFE